MDFKEIGNPNEIATGTPFHKNRSMESRKAGDVGENAAGQIALST
jgi:hypothetical protein